MSDVTGHFKLSALPDGRDQYSLVVDDLPALLNRFSRGKFTAKAGDAVINLRGIQTPLGEVDVRLEAGAVDG